MYYIYILFSHTSFHRFLFFGALLSSVPDLVVSKRVATGKGIPSTLLQAMVSVASNLHRFAFQKKQLIETTNRKNFAHILHTLCMVETTEPEKQTTQTQSTPE